MKKLLLTLLVATFNIGVAVASTPTPQTILFVCGGNTGRSVMSEFYTLHNYGVETVGESGVETFSRGSGIDPQDGYKAEPFARELIIENNEATKDMIDLHRATPADITDIYKSTIVLTMGTRYNERLKNLIDRECSDFNVNYPNRNFSKDQWVAMCSAKDALKAKIHTLIGCATGTDGDIPDAFRQDKQFYIDTRNNIKTNIDLVMGNHRATNSWCLSSQSARPYWQ